jgi:hypothetical protein
MYQILTLHYTDGEVMVSLLKIVVLDVATLPGSSRGEIWLCQQQVKRLGVQAPKSKPYLRETPTRNNYITGYLQMQVRS